MKQIATTPEPPYYAVVFTSVRTSTDEGYADAAEQMMALASEQPGFLGVESVRQAGGLGITVSYWKDADSIRNGISTKAVIPKTRQIAKHHTSETP